MSDEDNGRREAGATQARLDALDKGQERIEAALGRIESRMCNDIDVLAEKIQSTDIKVGRLEERQGILVAFNGAVSAALSWAFSQFAKP